MLPGPPSPHSPTQEVESGPKDSGAVASGPPSHCSSHPALLGTAAGRGPGPGQAENAGPQGRGPWGPGAALPYWAPSAGGWRAVSSPGRPPPRATFTFYFLHPPKQEGPGRASGPAGGDGVRTGGAERRAWGRRGLSSFLCPRCTPRSKSPLRIFPYGPPLTGILSKALISHDPYLTGPTLWGQGGWRRQE